MTTQVRPALHDVPQHGCPEAPHDAPDSGVDVSGRVDPSELPSASDMAPLLPLEAEGDAVKDASPLDEPELPPDPLEVEVPELLPCAEASPTVPLST